MHLRAGIPGISPRILALYEPWFGHPQHISVGYSSHDPAELHKQIRAAKKMGIYAFVVDWYGDRDAFNARTYELLQPIAAQEHFHIAMMYDETDHPDGATDEAIADFTTFRDSFLAPNAPGSSAYLTDNGRPMIFIFPKGGHTDWNRVRQEVSKWNPAPLLIDESFPSSDIDAFDGFYAWVQPGAKGWAADGSNWGADYLANFYSTMTAKYPGKIAVGGAWSQFNDSRASWSLNRHISARCGQTFQDTFNFWRKYYPADQPLPYLMIDTWNDYEEGTAIEPGIPTCKKKAQQSH
ncbi:MAG: hypothetical protein ACLGXA_08785 [Acidobacteriota bacterium]